MLNYLNTGIVFQEIPDEVTLSINITGCPCRCPGCHSQYLWENIGEPLTPMVLDQFVANYHGEITCICFMGGDADPKYVSQLAQYLHREHPQLKVAWYSGRQQFPRTLRKRDFDYIKLGPYIEHLGCLKERTTNQRLYKRAAGGYGLIETVDAVSYSFWVQGIAVYIACTGFFILFHVHDWGSLLCAAGGTLTWLVYLFCHSLGCDIFAMNFFAAAVAAVYAESMARARKYPVTSYLVISIVPLLPGAGIYYTMAMALGGSMQQALHKGMETAGVAGSIAAAILLVSTVFHLVTVQRARWRAQ